LCRTGHDNACLQQIMPGNHVHGGFATEIVVPARSLVKLPEHLGGYDLADLSVVADAVTTPYQALERAAVRAGNLVVVIGVGGIGTYAVQIARARGARVAAIDLDVEKLERIATFVDWRFDAREDAAAIKTRLKSESGCETRWKIFEMSGTKAGQELAWSLLVPAATLGVIGFTMDKAQLRLSNLMALDATAFGTWGCSPSLYGDALGLVLTGRVTLKPFIERRPIADGPALFAELANAHNSGRRTILIPE
jgi:6-hydroxycyclohex-1-ene-1-carbonyl-CoA dehydrogenase